MVAVCCTFGALVVLLWLALARGYAVAAGAFGLICAALVAGAAVVLRVRLRAKGLGFIRHPSAADDSASEHRTRPLTP